MARPRCPTSAVTPFGMRWAPSLNKSMEARRRLPLLLRSCVCSRKRIMTLVPPPPARVPTGISLPHEQSWYNDNVGNGGGQTPLRRTPASSAWNRLPGSLIPRGEGDKSEAHRRAGIRMRLGRTLAGVIISTAGSCFLRNGKRGAFATRHPSDRRQRAGPSCLVATAGHVVYAPDGATGVASPSCLSLLDSGCLPTVTNPGRCGSRNARPCRAAATGRRNRPPAP